MKAVYKIVNTVNNRIYIGQTTDIETRWYNHRYELKNNTHSNIHLQSDWNSQYKDDFDFNILKECNSKEELLEVEKLYVKKYKSNNMIYGYNLTSGGKDGNLNEEVKHRMSIGKRGSKSDLTIEQVEKIKMALYCGMDRKEIMNMFGLKRGRLTSISTSSVYDYVCEELNETIHNFKQKLIDERNRIIVQYYDDGKTITNISVDLGYSMSIVEKCIYKYRGSKKDYSKRKISQSNEVEVLNMYNSGKSGAYIGNIYGVSDTTIMNIVNSNKATTH